MATSYEFDVGDKVLGIGGDIVDCEGIIEKDTGKGYNILITKIGNHSWQGQGDLIVGKICQRNTYWKRCLQLIKKEELKVGDKVKVLSKTYPGLSSDTLNQIGKECYIVEIENSVNPIRYTVSNSKETIMGNYFRREDLEKISEEVESGIRGNKPSRLIIDEAGEIPYMYDGTHTNGIISTLDIGSNGHKLHYNVTSDPYNYGYDIPFPGSFYGMSASELITEQKKLINKPKKTIMSTITNAFKSKEDKAMEYFGLGSSKELNSDGRREFTDFIFETGTTDKKAFLDKIVEAHKEATK